MPKSIASLHLTHLSNLLVKSSHGRFTKDLVTCLHSVLMTIPGIGTVNGGMILGENCLHLPDWIQPYISLETFRPKEPVCSSEGHVYFGMPS